MSKMENKMRRKKENVNIEALERKIENQKIKDSMNTYESASDSMLKRVVDE